MVRFGLIRARFVAKNDVVAVRRVAEMARGFGWSF